jgi:hypothetical protein
MSDEAMVWELRRASIGGRERGWQVLRDGNAISGLFDERSDAEAALAEFRSETRTEPSTVTDEGLVERLNKLKQLEDDVRHYSGNEASGFAEIARRKAELFDDLASGHTALLREIEDLRSALERLDRNFDLLLAGKPVRDVAETKAETRAALSRPDSVIASTLVSGKNKP